VFPPKSTVDVERKSLAYAMGIFLMLYVGIFLSKEEGIQIQGIIHNHHYWLKEKAS